MGHVECESRFGAGEYLRPRLKVERSAGDGRQTCMGAWTLAQDTPPAQEQWTLRRAGSALDQCFGNRRLAAGPPWRRPLGRLGGREVFRTLVGHMFCG
jgi:hypothetical protein